MTPLHLLLVGVGGAIGAMGRYATGVLLGQWLGTNWPYGTFTVNIIGGLLMGLLVGLEAWITSDGPGLRLFLAIGILGGFTTFSSFSLDVMAMLERQQWLAAAGYATASVVLSVLALGLGIFLVRSLAGP